MTSFTAPGSTRNIKQGNIIQFKLGQSKEVFLQKLSEIPFPNYTNFECVSAAYEDFVNELLGVIDMVAPLKEIRIKGNSKSWFDSDI